MPPAIHPPAMKSPVDPKAISNGPWRALLLGALLSLLAPVFSPGEHFSAFGQRPGASQGGGGRPSGGGSIGGSSRPSMGSSSRPSMGGSSRPSIGGSSRPSAAPRPSIGSGSGRTSPPVFSRPPAPSAPERTPRYSNPGLPDRGPVAPAPAPSSGGGRVERGEVLSGSTPGFGAPRAPETVGEARNPRDGQLRPLHNGPDRPRYVRFPAPYRPSAGPGSAARPAGSPAAGGGRADGYLAPGDRSRSSADLSAVPQRYPGPNRELLPALDEVRGSLQRLSDRQRYGRGPLQRLSRPEAPAALGGGRERATPLRRDPARLELARSPGLDLSAPETRRRSLAALGDLRRLQERDPARAERLRAQAQRLASVRADLAAAGTTRLAGSVAGSLVRRRLGGQGALPGGSIPGGGDLGGGAAGDQVDNKGLWIGGGFHPGWSFGFGYGWGCGVWGWPYSFAFGSSWFWWNYWNHPCFGPGGWYWGFGGGYWGGWGGGFSPWHWWTPYPWWHWGWNPPLYYAVVLQNPTPQPTTVIVEQAAPAPVAAPAAEAAPEPVFAPSPLASAPAAPSQPMGPAGERYLTLGDRAFRDGRYGDAAHYYGKAVAAQPESGVLHLVLADALFATGDYATAAAAIRRGLELDANLVWSTIDKRSFYRDPSDFDAQLAVLELYLVDHPSDREAELLLALNYLFGNAPARAVDVLADWPRGDRAADLIRAAAEEVQFGRPAEVR